MLGPTVLRAYWWLCFQKTTPGGTWDHMWCQGLVLETKPRSALCKSSIFPAVLSLNLFQPILSSLWLISESKLS